LKEQRVRCCDACGNRNFVVLIDNLSHYYQDDGVQKIWRYRLLECQECGLGFVDPEPTTQMLTTFYDQTYACYRPIRDNIATREMRFGKYWIAKQRYAIVGSEGMRAIAATTLGMAIELVTGRTVSYSLGLPLQLSKDAKIFDLGYGSGSWLFMMSRLGYKNLFGYDVDFNTGYQLRLREKGISVSDGVFLENDYPDSYFDLIRLEHVLEHLSHPIQVLRKCRTMLKPGGWLVMNFPCKRSWSAYLSLKHFAHLDVPRHLYHHTPKSAELMVKASGLNVLKVKTYSVMLVFSATVNNMLTGGRKTRILSCLLAILAPLYKLVGLVTGYGDNITIWASRF
jgi:2-polyprenyl-3-methyl-5-hydroxy-6-metoxy-1,4-benzoquinol methylase